MRRFKEGELIVYNSTSTGRVLGPYKVVRPGLFAACIWCKQGRLGAFNDTHWGANVESGEARDALYKAIKTNVDDFPTRCSACE